MKKNSYLIIISSSIGNWTLSDSSPEFLNTLKSLQSFNDFRNFALDYLK